MDRGGIKLLWGTANLFSNPRYMNGAGSSNSADVFCFSAAQIKRHLISPLSWLAMNDMLGSIDANQGDYLPGWDIDQFPSNVYETTMCEVLKAGGLKMVVATIYCV